MFSYFLGDPLLNTPVDMLFTPRISEPLKKAGYKTAEDLVKARPYDLNHTTNIGVKSINLIKKRIEALGYPFPNNLF